MNPNHVVDKDTFLAACPQLQQLGFIQDFGTKVLQNGAHTYVVPLTVDDYGRGTPRVGDAHAEVPRARIPAFYQGVCREEDPSGYESGPFNLLGRLRWWLWYEYT